MQAQEQTKKEVSVFATFKNYKKSDAPEKKMKRLLVGKNRYTRLGNIEDWNITQQPKAETNVKNISFAAKRAESVFCFQITELNLLRVSCTASLLLLN
jgi:hypothetical protein